MIINRQELKERAKSMAELRAWYPSGPGGALEGALECAGDTYAWFTVDTGSGGYSIHTMLYKVVAGRPRLVLYVPPSPLNLVGVTAVAEKNRIVIQGTDITGSAIKGRKEHVRWQKVTIAYHYPDAARESGREESVDHPLPPGLSRKSTQPRGVQPAGVP